MKMVQNIKSEESDNLAQRNLTLRSLLLRCVLFTKLYWFSVFSQSSSVAGLIKAAAKLRIIRGFVEWQLLLAYNDYEQNRSEMENKLYVRR